MQVEEQGAGDIFCYEGYYPRMDSGEIEISFSF